MRFIQHKREAYWFYRFLSIFYDKYVNPLFWTEWMRDQCLALAQLSDPTLKVIDVGSGTGFTTQGIVRHLPANQVTCVDQSPHQIAKAKDKADLKGCTFQIGDAENIPFPTDHFDRYISAGSIEYWPNPQQGINEAYRVIKPGGVALLIGPLQPEGWLGRLIADAWMLFPSEKEYMDWYAAAGFTKIAVHYVQPQWFRGKGKYGIALAGVKATTGVSPNIPSNALEAKTPESPTFARRLLLPVRLLVGSLAGFLFIPAALFGYARNAFENNKEIPEQYRERLNAYQWGAIFAIIAIIALLVWLIIR